MSYQAYTFIAAVQHQILANNPCSIEELNISLISEKYMYTSFSRNDEVFYWINKLNASGLPPLPEYLFQYFDVIFGERIRCYVNTLSAFVSALESDSTFIIETTKTLYNPQITLHCNNPEMSIDAELIYPQAKKIEQGWHYCHDQDSVKELFDSIKVALFDNTQIGSDEGEGIEYAISVLMIHLRLMSLAVENDMAIVFSKSE